MKSIKLTEKQKKFINEKLTPYAMSVAATIPLLVNQLAYADSGEELIKIAINLLCIILIAPAAFFIIGGLNGLASAHADGGDGPATKKAYSMIGAGVMVILLDIGLKANSSTIVSAITSSATSTS